MKKFKTAILTIATALTLGACSNYTYPDFANWDESKKMEIGILLPVEHGALNKATEGFIYGLEANDFKDGERVNITIKNAQGNPDDQKTMAKTLINTCVLTLGVGTGASKDLVEAQKNKGSQNPILFTAVTDPVKEKLVASMENTTGLITGSSDQVPESILDSQLDLIKRFIPDADKIGVFYTESETNSEAQALLVKTWAQQNGMETAMGTCSNSTDIALAAQALADTEGLDAIYVPTDNNIAANMYAVKDAVKNKHILVICGEESLVTSGGHVSISLDYFLLGVKTGIYAAQILRGDVKPNELPVHSVTSEECTAVYSAANLLDAGFVDFASHIDDTFTCVDAE